MSAAPDTETTPRRLFLPSRRAAAIIALLGLAALGAALFLRYAIIQNSGLGVACEAGEESLICTVRLAVIVLFVRGAFGWGALIAAAIALWRPNVVAFGAGVVLAILGLVLYNTRTSALAVALLVLSLARPRPSGR
jgi:hypothetical protein